MVGAVQSMVTEMRLMPLYLIGEKIDSEDVQVLPNFKKVYL